MLTAVLLLLLLACREGAADCLAHDDNPYLYFATKTSYQFVYDKRIRGHDVPNCRAVAVWGYLRHGTRYPSADLISRMNQELPPLKKAILENRSLRRAGEMCPEDLEALSKWKLLFSENQAEELAEQGHIDLYFLAKRLKSYFPAALDATYTPQRFHVLSSDAKRCVESGKAFMEGLLGRDTPHFPDTPQDLHQSFLAGDSNCSSWEESKLGWKPELERLDAGDDILHLISEVSRRAGFKYNLTLDTIHLMYEMCRYDKALNYTATSPWCAVFNNDELRLLEFREDLKYYYQSGYGNPMTARMGCPVAKHMMDTFQSVVDAGNSSEADGEEAGRGVFIVGHSEALRAAAVMLGVARDPAPLTPSSFPASKRQWRTSFLSPFAGNLILVLFRCKESEEYRVMLYLGENMVDYEGCEVGLCSWSYLKEKFAHLVSSPQCNEASFCSPHSGAASVFLLPRLLLVALSVLFLR